MATKKDTLIALHNQLVTAGLPIAGVRYVPSVNGDVDEDGTFEVDWGEPRGPELPGYEPPPWTPPTPEQITAANLITTNFNLLLEKKRVEFYRKYSVVNIVDMLLDYVDTGVKSAKLIEMITARREVR